MTIETTQKLHPGQTLPPLIFSRLDGPDFTFGAQGKWQMLVVYRGQHCPICQKYLKLLQEKHHDFESLGIELAVISADDESQARRTQRVVKPGFPLLYGLDEAAMVQLGLYISTPRSDKETDHLFPEPALLIVNPDQALQIVDIANAPFVRPDIDTLISGLGFVIDKKYPIRGAYR